MSTVKAVNFQHPSASTPAITLDSTGAMTGSLPYPNRNLLHNSAMQIHQRGTSASGLTSGGYLTADRWFLALTTLGTWTQTIENDAPTGSGFRKSLKMLCTTANASPAAGSYVYIDQIIEGQDLQRIAKGTSAAQSLAVSFWVKSNVTGTYTILLYDGDNSRSVSASYTINNGSTWEYKKIVFPPDTTGAFDNDNLGSLYFRFALATGSNVSSGTLNTVWNADVVANRHAGQINLGAANNNFWQMTGVQLEASSAPTPFEFKSYAQELRECQRYYVRLGNSDEGAYAPFGFGHAVTTTRADVVVPFPVPMRVIPTTVTGANLAVTDQGSNTAVTAFSAGVNSRGRTMAICSATVASGLTAFRPYQLIANGNTAGYIEATADL